jgi:hypothetical protein
MRIVIFGIALAAVTAVGFDFLIGKSITAAWDSRPASFEQRFAPVLKPA